MSDVHKPSTHALEEMVLYAHELCGWGPHGGLLSVVASKYGEVFVMEGEDVVLRLDTSAASKLGAVLLMASGAGRLAKFKGGIDLPVEVTP